jgi:protease-4
MTKRSWSHTRALPVALALVLGGCIFDLGSLTRTDPLEATVVHGDSGPKIAMIDIRGVISESGSQSPLGPSRPSMVATTVEALDRAREDDVRALLVRIQSPGGAVSASETIYYEILRWKQETGRPVVAYMQGMATSGGYYAAMASDEIVAHPTAITGSIGVILAGVNVSGLMERFGIQDQTFTSGAFKDSGSPLRPMRDDEREHIGAVVDDLYARFREVVALGRPALDEAALAPLTDGRIFSARQALDVGLVDRLGHFDEAIRVVEARAGLTESRVVVYHRPDEFRDNVFSRGSLPPVQIVDVNILSLPLPRLEPGFYYLWPGALGR